MKDIYLNLSIEDITLELEIEKKPSLTDNDKESIDNLKKELINKGYADENTSYSDLDDIVIYIANEKEALEKDINDVKEALVENELIAEGTPNDLIPEAIEEGLKDFVKPSGTLEITENGEYDVTDKASVNVNVAGSGEVDYLGLRLSQKELYEYSNSEVIVIPEYAFYKDYKITKLNFPNITKISDFGCHECWNLIEFNAPKLKNIGQYAFQNTEITQANYPLVTTIGAGAFNACNPLKYADLPQVTTGAMKVFQNAVNLETINIPLLNKVLSDMFTNCYTLKYINLPNATSIETNGFKNCYKLKSANFTKLTTLSSSAFYSSYSLQALIIQTSSVATLSSTSAFTNCYHILGTVNSTYNPDGLKDGYIFVPDNLVEGYKAASNWSTYASQIKGLSQLPQEYKDLYGIE